MPSEDIEQARWFAEEVHPHDGALRHYLRRSFPEVSDIEDLVQESYLRVWRRQAARPIESAKAFVFKVARHVAIDAVRRSRRSPIDAVADLASLRVPSQGRDAAAAACANEEIAMLAEALEALPPRVREIVILRKFENLTQREVAERLRISELTVQEQVYRGVRRIEKLLIRRGVIRGWEDA